MRLSHTTMKQLWRRVGYTVLNRRSDYWTANPLRLINFAHAFGDLGNLT